MMNRPRRAESNVLSGFETYRRQMSERASDATEYRAGYCNIGRQERRKRYAGAGLSFFGAVCYLGAVLLLELPLALLLGLFVMLFVAIEWYIQARTAFCARFALLGKYDFTGSGGETGTVDDPTDRRTDRRQAVQVTAIALVFGAVLTTAIYFIADSLLTA